ncbi:hypothetical protein AK812_SmicGene3115 [Symbiodinium microadriaticum]|uniref:Uncharacterized protein n=1 Tax=Symbiodinium microadriaticum TaxID=2951 RepID=A0A1Q9EZU8_SYMMI|nr:hypothetical protein AK812_SmicGene3115 [Symbiodinium microadriaticum]
MARGWLRPYQQREAWLIPVGYPYSHEMRSLNAEALLTIPNHNLSILLWTWNFFWVADRLFLVILRKLTSLFVESKFSPWEKKYLASIANSSWELLRWWNAPGSCSSCRESWLEPYDIEEVTQTTEV